MPLMETCGKVRLRHWHKSPKTCDGCDERIAPYEQYIERTIFVHRRPRGSGLEAERLCLNCARIAGIEWEEK